MIRNALDLERKFKVKVWDHQSRTWLNATSLSLAREPAGFVVAGVWVYADLYGLHQVQLFQFTGCSDMTGKEIYEGSLCDVPTDNGPVLTLCRYSNDSFYLFTAKDNHRYVLNFNYKDESGPLVVGHIADSPSLWQEACDR